MAVRGRTRLGRGNGWGGTRQRCFSSRGTHTGISINHAASSNIVRKSCLHFSPAPTSNRLGSSRLLIRLQTWNGSPHVDSADNTGVDRLPGAPSLVYVYPIIMARAVLLRTIEEVRSMARDCTLGTGHKRACASQLHVCCTQKGLAVGQLHSEIVICLPFISDTILIRNISANVNTRCLQSSGSKKSR